MGKRGSAHRAFGSGIFAYAGYKGDGQGWFWLLMLLMPASLFVLEELPVLSSGARGGPSSLTFVDDDKVCTADKARIHLAGTRSGQRPAPGRHEREVPFFFPLGLGVCVL